MARVLFSTIGPWGDLFPVIGMALEVQGRGHDVEITASPAWNDVVEDAGVAFTPVGRRIGFVPGGTPLGPWKGPVGRVFNRLSWVTGGIATSAMFDRPINAHRRTLGLPPIRNALINLQLGARGIVVLADPTVIDPPPDWPDHVHIASFVNWDRIDAPSVTAKVHDFLEEGEPPVLVTLGTSASTVAGDFLQHATEELLEQGARVLTVTGPAPPVPDVAPDLALSVDYVPYSTVLPACRAAVYHAGIGTTLAVLRAGLPQLAVPKSHDQPDTARLIERLGVGLQIPWKRRHRRFGHAADRLLHDDQLAANATRLGAELTGRDGAQLAANTIDDLLEGCVPRQDTTT